MSAGGEFIGLYLYLSDSRVPASVVCSHPSSRDLSQESWKGYSGPMRGLFLGAARRHTLSVVGRSASVLVGRCAVVAAQLQTAHHKEFAELSVPRDAP